MRGDFRVRLGPGAVISEVGTDTTIAESNLRLQDVVAGHRGTDAPTLGDIAPLTSGTDLLGMASNATKLEVDLTALDRETRFQRGKERTAFFRRSPTEGAQLRMASEEQATKRSGDGREDAREDEIKVIHGRGGLGLASFLGRGGAGGQHAKSVQREGHMADQEEDCTGRTQQGFLRVHSLSEGLGGREGGPLSPAKE